MTQGYASCLPAAEDLQRPLHGRGLDAGTKRYKDAAEHSKVSKAASASAWLSTSRLMLLAEANVAG